MSDAFLIHDVQFTPGTRADRARGLLGYTAFSVGPLRVDGATLRQTADGRLTISFPERRDARGRRHPIVRPLSRSARQELEQQLLALLDALPRGGRGGPCHPDAGSAARDVERRSGGTRGDTGGAPGSPDGAPGARQSRAVAAPRPSREAPGDAS